jgi:cytochrome c
MPRSIRGTIIALLASISSVLLANPAAPVQGKDIFERRCAGCHATDRNQEGPKLRGVYGRRAAGVPQFGYSEGLKKLNDYRLEAGRIQDD